MAGFNLKDIQNLETTSSNPNQLKTKVGEMIQHSSNVRARVESVNPETGEYRLVLQGTLQKEQLKS